MIEELKLLIPMLEGVADGAIFAFVVYMISHVITSMLWPLCFLLATYILAKAFVKVTNYNSDISQVHEIRWGDDKSLRAMQSSERHLEELFSLQSS